jgi:hypothetical protein
MLARRHSPLRYNAVRHEVIPFTACASKRLQPIGMRRANRSSCPWPVVVQARRRDTLH